MSGGREALFHPFLGATLWAKARLSPLAGDASNRRYLRAQDAVMGSAVLMDAPPETGEDIRPFCKVTDLLRSRGLSAPRIEARDAAQGLLLLEDLGDALFAKVAANSPGTERQMYEAATDLIAHLANDPGPWPEISPYDVPTYLAEARLLTDWYLPGHGCPVTPKVQAEYDTLIQDLCAGTGAQGATLTLRDYHAENLIWLPKRAGLARVGLLDYQDALVGPPAYDLVSLLEDARRDVSDSLAQDMIARFVQATGAGTDAFARDYAILGAQRNLKILGIFARLWLRDGKPGYLGLLDRVWGHLQRDLAHPALAPLSAWIARHVPAPQPDRLRAART
ncbi:MAG: phosphotransferase [Pseudomonadota bacterium]